MLQAIRRVNARDWLFLTALVALVVLLVAIPLILLIASNTFVSGALAAALNIETYRLLVRPLCRWYNPPSPPVA